jgi:hypothetical protein
MLPFMHRSAVPRLAVCLVSISLSTLFGQSTPSNPAATPTGQASRAAGAQPATQEELPRRIFGIIPNYRSYPSFQNAKPLTPSEKFKIAARDSFDPGTFLLAGAFAGINQATNAIPSYGQGMAGYGRYYGATYGDFMIGNFMTEGVYPTLLHQDPRYFRRGTGSGWSRLGYAMGQIVVTHGDNRRTQFNYSEICGNATAVAISNAYNPDNRTASDAVSKLAVQLGVDMAGNILKEFAPDLYRRVHPKKKGPSYSGQPVSK